MWNLKNTFAIGGLENVGFACNRDILLVLSSQGQGIFDCLNGNKIARKKDEADWWKEFNEETNTIRGFDGLENEIVKTCGLYGDDILKKSTKDGWTLIISEPQPDDKPFEKYLIRKIYLVNSETREEIFVGKDGACELRAFGFSDTGNSFIIALSCDLTIYSRV